MACYSYLNADNNGQMKSTEIGAAVALSYQSITRITAMFQVNITGKPSDFKELPEDKNGQLWAVFTLTERAFVNGAPLERKWKVFVPQHKIKWTMKKTTNPKYTVMVQADDLFMATDTIHGYSVRLTEIYEV